MSVEVRPVDGRRDLRRFMELPFELHAHEPMWMPPLKQDQAQALSKSNPLWNGKLGERELFLAWNGRRVVGRIMAHVHHASNRVHNERAGFFGLMECPDDVDVARALLDAVAQRHQRAGLTLLRGPYDMTIHQCVGAMTSGFDEPAAFSQTWHPPHLHRLIEQLGFTRAYSVTTFRHDDLQSLNADTLLTEKHAQWRRDARVKVRTASLSRLNEDIHAGLHLLNTSFADNYGFVAMTDEEVDFIATPARRVMRPELTVFLEIDDEPVAVCMCLPDFHVLFKRMKGDLFPLGWAQFLVGSRTLDAAVLQFLATSPKFQNKGLMRMVMAEVIRQLQKANFRTLDVTWVGEANVASRRTMLSMGMREKHQLALYARPL